MRTRKGSGTDFGGSGRDPGDIRRRFFGKILMVSRSSGGVNEVLGGEKMIFYDFKRIKEG